MGRQIKSSFMGKIRFGIVEITADGKKTIERVYNLDRFELKNADTYEIKQEFSSVQEMDIAYKTLTTGKIVQSTIRTIEPFSAKYLANSTGAVTSKYNERASWRTKVISPKPST